MCAVTIHTGPAVTREMQESMRSPVIAALSIIPQLTTPSPNIEHLRKTISYVHAEVSPIPCNSSSVLVWPPFIAAQSHCHSLLSPLLPRCSTFVLRPKILQQWCIDGKGKKLQNSSDKSANKNLNT